MAARKFKQMIIQLKYNGKLYDIRAESIKPTLKQDEEEYYATNSVYPYGKALDKRTLEFQINGIDPDQYSFFKNLFIQQHQQIGAFFSVATYEYDSKRKTRKRDGFTGCSITEISNETAEPFDIKCSALGLA